MIALTSKTTRILLNTGTYASVSLFTGLFDNQKKELHITGVASEAEALEAAELYVQGKDIAVGNDLLIYADECVEMGMVYHVPVIAENDY